MPVEGGKHKYGVSDRFHGLAGLEFHSKSLECYKSI
jgi:hypothetical protein